MTVHGVVYEDDTMWVDFGPGVIVLQGSQCEGIELGDMLYDGPTVVGWATPPIEREHEYPKLLPGYRLEQVKRTGPMAQRAMDHIFNTPFGDRWLFQVVKDEEA